MEYDLPPKSVGDNIEAWTAARLGKATASRIFEVVERTKKGEPTAARGKYKLELICERLTGMRQEVFVNQAMLHGIECEADAIRAYERSEEVTTQEVWFIEHPAIAMSGASPDRLIGKEGILEVKCPTSRTHIETLLTREPNPKYIAQVQWQMACTGRAWADLISFDPRVPKEFRLFRFHIERDPAMIAAMEDMVAEFLGEIERDLQALGTYTPVMPKKGDAREEISTSVGYSDSLPESTFGGIEDLVKRGLIKRGM